MMTKAENKLYKRVDDACYMSTELDNLLESIRYDPSGATEQDVKAMRQIQDLLGKAVRIARETEERMRA